MRLNKKTLDSFIDYCKLHPHERFYQALRNWSRFNFIMGFDKLPDEGIDTFYFEGRDK